MPPEISRADLLRVLSGTPSGQAAPLARLLGWELDETSAGLLPSPVASGPAVATPAASAEPVIYRVRPAPRYWRVLACEPLPRAPTEDAGEGQGIAPTDSGEAPPQDRPIAPVLQAGQWQNLWDRLPPSSRPGRRIDVRASVRRLARGQPMRALPRRPGRGFNRAVTLILDRPQALRPVWDDMRRAKLSLQALFGEELQGFHLTSGPRGPWFGLNGASRTSPGAKGRAAATGLGGPEAIPDQALVVLISAFGALESGEIARDWQDLLRALAAAGHVLLLVPVCPLKQTGLPTAPLDPSAGRYGRAGSDQVLRALLAALSQTWLPTPARLRELRRALPGADLHTELRVYNHPGMEHDTFHLGLAPGQLLARLHQFQALPPALRLPLQKAIDAWRDGLDAGARDIERLQADLLNPGPPSHYPQLTWQAAQAEKALHGRGDMALAQFCGMLPVLKQLRDQTQGKRWRALLRRADKVARATGRAPLAEVSGTQSDAATHGLRQRGERLIVQPGPAGILAIGPEAYSTETGQLVDGAPLAEFRDLEIIDRGRRWRLDAIVRPGWAQRLWSDGGDLFAAHADNAIFAWRPAAPDLPLGHWAPEQNPWPWAREIGIDRYGLWALLQVNSVDHRLRWIPPGRFLMGSPEDEPERDDDERQHQVALTQGFWLGPTAVTQALWRAVTGQNPSHFKGDDLPVEQVSWDDCQGFLIKLSEMALGLEPALPTEAQWEYACRAGTRTPFSFGDTLDTDRANYNGGYPYNEGPKGEYRAATLPVRSFDPNPWGLYQMHGNVWEWCADWFGDYPTDQATDPTGPIEGRYRVLRGGAWSYHGRDLRSAYRSRYPPDDRDQSIGLRLAGGFDPQAGQAGAGAATADGREQSERQGGGRGAGGAGVDGRPGTVQPEDSEIMS